MNFEVITMDETELRLRLCSMLF